MRLFFPKQFRLTESDQFGRLLKARGALRDKFFVGHRLPNGRSLARLGLVIPKRLVGSSVARNRVKRFVKEEFRINQWRLSGFDIVVRLHKSVSAEEMVAVRLELRNLFLNIAR